MRLTLARATAAEADSEKLLQAIARSEVGATASQNVSVTDVENGSAVLIGKLGKPLGTVVTIEATVVVVPPPRVMGSGMPGRFFALKVERIDGLPVKEPLTMNFTVDSVLAVKLASNEFELTNLLKHLREPGRFSQLIDEGVTGSTPISSEAADAIGRDYVGSPHRLHVYETANLSGTPPNFPSDLGFMAGYRPFAFSTHLIVIAER